MQRLSRPSDETSDRTKHSAGPGPHQRKGVVSSPAACGSLPRHRQCGCEHSSCESRNERDHGRWSRQYAASSRFPGLTDHHRSTGAHRFRGMSAESQSLAAIEGISPMNTISRSAEQERSSPGGFSERLLRMPGQEKTPPRSGRSGASGSDEDQNRAI